MNNLLQKLVLGSSAAALVAAMPPGAFAQDSNDIEQVVVSASRITIAGYTQPTPVTVIGAAQLEQNAYASIQDELRQLPEVNAPPSYVTANSGGLSPTAGNNNIVLRSLNPIRTLTLLDGQRVVDSNLQNAAVDITTFPTALISRVDIVTGGASASWGSDAVTGVVNFVLDKNYNGFKARLEATDTSNNLFRGFTGSAAWGGDIDGGRGHIEFSVEARINPDTVVVTEENWSRNPYWVSNPAYAAGNGQPQLIVANNIGNAQATVGGIINSSPAGSGLTPSATNALRGIEFVGAGIPQVVNYGNLTLGAISNGGSLTTPDGEWAYQPIANSTSSYMTFGYGRYKLTDTIQASVQLNYSYFTGKNPAASYLQTGLVIRSDNPYIPASVAATMKAGGITSFTLGTLDVNNFNTAAVTSGNIFNQSQPAMGPITNFNRRNFLRGVFSLDGTLSDDWSWNAYVEDSQVRNSEHAPNNPILANINNAEDAVTVTSANVGKSGLALGSIACRSTVTGTSFVFSGSTAQSGCVPLNVFGNGVASSQAIGYIDGATAGTQSYNNSRFEQEVAEASMQGTLPWQLPAGKVAVAFGAGYRRESAFASAPPITLLGGTAFIYAQGSALVPFPNVSYNILEGFGEVDAPILKNTIVNSLDVSVAGRMTSYSTSGLVETWKLGATSQINDDVKLRATWSTDIRAPNLYELYNPGTASANVVRDPNTQANVSEIQLTKGNTNLNPEVAHTVSGGMVLTPTFIPGLSLSADWWNINLTGEITTLSNTTILAQCNASLPSVIHPGQNGNPNDPLCKFLVFGGPGGALSQLNLQTINIASQRVSGLDLAANYTMDFWDGTLGWAAKSTLMDENTTTNPNTGVNDGAGTGDLGQNATTGPKWRGIISAAYNTGPYSVTVQSRWYGTAVTNQNGNTGNLAAAATANLYDPAHYEIPAVAYLDLRGTYKWNDNIAFYGAVDNVMDIPPPLDPSISTAVVTGQNVAGTLFGVYDTLGRVFRVGVRFNY